ncbi:MAG: glycosyltransferase family 39 protein [Anaerolineae bacterium]
MERSGLGRYYAVAIALIALAFGLRAWGLTATSLWYDETFVLYHAQQGVLTGILGLLREDNALPLHGLLLALWIKVAGSGEFAARYLSVLLGTIAAALILRLGGIVMGRRYGGWGATLAYATLPIYVYYTQEVRMYALVIPLAAGFAWMGWRVVERGRGVAVYVILGTAMMMAHLYAGLLWAAIFVWGSCWLLVQSHKSRVTRHASRITYHIWWRANLWLGLMALPIAAWGLWRARVDATAVSAIPMEALNWIPLLFGVGQYLPAPWAPLFVAVTVLALIAALAGLWRTRRVQGVWWLLITLILPVVLLLAATFVKAKWSERYLLPSFGLTLVLGVGVGWESLVVSPKSLVFSQKLHITYHVSRVIGVLLLVAWLVLAIPALARQAQGTWAMGIVDEWHPRPDFRGVARYIEERDAPDDVIVVIGGYAAHTLDYYYDGPAHLFGLPFDTRVLDTQHPLDLHALVTLEQQTQSAQRLWLVLWQDMLADPTRLVLSSLIEACHRLPVDAHFTNVGVVLFDMRTCRPLDRLVVPPHPLVADFTEPIRMTGYDLIKIGETWEVDVWWETYGQLPTNYLVFVHLIGSDGTLIAQHDHVAGMDAYSTSQWTVGTALRDRFFLNVPGGTCDQCSLRVGLYTEDGRLPLRDGSDTIVIEPTE